MKEKSLSWRVVEGAVPEDRRKSRGGPAGGEAGLPVRGCVGDRRGDNEQSGVSQIQVRCNEGRQRSKGGRVMGRHQTRRGQCGAVVIARENKRWASHQMWVPIRYKTMRAGRKQLLWSVRLLKLRVWSELMGGYSGTPKIK